MNKKDAVKKLIINKFMVFISVMVLTVGMMSSVVVAITGITVTSPNGEEDWQGTQSITWSSDCVSGENINIFLGKDGTIGNPTSSSVIALNTACSPKSFAWNTIGKVDATDYQVRIESFSFPTGIFDWSDDFFTIDNTDPEEATSVTSSSHIVSTWSNDNIVVVTWTDATDATSGLDGYSIVWDTTSNTLPDTTKDIEEGVQTTTSPALSDGNSHYFHIRSVDNAGNWDDTAVHLGPFFIDTTVPTIADDYTNDNVWINSVPQTVTLSPADTGGSGLVADPNGVKFCEGVSCDPSAGSTLSSPYQITYNSEQETTVRYQAYDDAGGASAIGEYVVKIDLIDPVVGGVIITPSHGSTFISGTSTISAEITDTAGTANSGVASCEYTINGESTWNTASFAGTTCTATDIDTTTATSINMRGTDEAGNSDTGTAVVVTVDTTPPVTTDDSSPTPTWQNSAVVVTLSPSDAGSGVDDTLYCIDQTNTCDPDTSGTNVNVNAEGNNTVRYFSFDNVGNIESVKTSNNILIDFTGPTVGVSDAPDDWLVDKAGVVIGVACSDDGSGCDAATFKVKVVTSGADCSAEDYSAASSTLNATSNIFVCATADDTQSNTGFSSVTEIKVHDTIQSAIDAATDGDTINVAAGTYAEQVTISKNNLVIQSTDGAATTIIDVTNKGTANGGIIFNGNGNTFDGFTVKDFTDSVNENKIIRINSNNNIIQNNIIQGNLKQGGITGDTEYGILFQSTASDNLIDSNEVFDIGNIGINIAGAAGASGNTIINNNVHDIGRYAITVDRAANSNVTGNTISNLIGGILNLFSDGDVLYLCVTSCYGIVVWGAGATGTTIDDQDLVNLPNGIALSSTQGVTVENSNISNNEFIGIRLGARSWPTDDSDHNVVVNNLIHDNDDGIVIVDSVEGNVLGSNNSINFNSIFDNTGGLANEESGVEINAENNWWGHVTGPQHSTNSDGQGDVVTDNVDFKPWSINTNHDTDLIAPTTVIDSPSASSWQNQDFAVSLTDSDTGVPVASGLKECKYRIRSSGAATKNLGNRDCSTTVTLTVGTAPKHCRNEGVDMCKIQAFAIDNANNGGEGVNMVERTFSIDFTAPTTTDDSDTTWHANDQTITLTPVDSVSGVASTTYCIYNEGDTACTPSTSGTSVSVTCSADTECRKIVRYSSSDVAGNVEVAHDSNTVKIDKLAPAITSVTGDLTSVINTPININATITDSGSDVKTAVLHFMDGTSDSITMDNVVGDIYNATIPAQLSSETLSYFITADDNVDNQARDPVGLDNYTITLRDIVLRLVDEWNLVSVPRTLNDSIKENIFTGDVWVYNAITKEWVEPTTINPGRGYWVNPDAADDVGLNYKISSTNQTVPSETIILQPSWNLIGHMCVNNQNVSVAFPSNIYNNLFVLRYNAANDEFEIFATQDAGTQEFTQMVPGEGYWVFVASGDELPYTNIC